MGFRSRLLKLAYQLHRHEFSGRALDRWLGIILAVIALVWAWGWLPGGWWVTAVAAILLVLLIAFELWARRAAYVHFAPQDAAILAPQPEKEPLKPEDKIAIRATGHFEVEGRRQFFADLQAFFRTFATREHAVIAYVPRSRFLGLGQWPSEEVGMWYIFFLPQQVIALEPGTLAFGGQQRPALRIAYQGAKRLETVYLTFDSEDDRQRVQDDILWDAEPSSSR
ncbi:MAG TPA: hypothetical protein G4O02_13765 [Caldilineae bacterium]|nr:hypothetical protein [Caldilineae bacterium]